MVVSMDRWKGKVAIVTGTSAGIGTAIAEALVDAGLQVAGLARRVERVQELAKKLEGRPGKLHPIKADLTKEADILEAFQWVKNTLGPVHVLINNAGVTKNSSLIEGETQKWRDVLDTNVLGLSIATREAVKDMRANKVNGHIVHINSILGHQVFPINNLSVYPASKFAVTALTETLRQELNLTGSKIKITSVSPGAVDTEIWVASGRRKVGESPVKNYPRLKAEDVADAVIYALGTPPHVQIHELIIKPVGENV